MKHGNTKIVVAAAAVFGAIVGVKRVGADVTLIQSAAAPGTSWPTGPDGTIPSTFETTTANPSAGTVSLTAGNGTVFGETFTAGSNLKLGAISLVGSGGQVTLSLHLFAMNQANYDPTVAAKNGGYVPATAFTGSDLFGGGSGLTVTYNGSGSTRIQTLDFSGADEVQLTQGTIYCFEFWTTGANTYFPQRAGQLTTTGGVYSASGASAQQYGSTVSRNQVAPGMRNMIFAVYPAASGQTGPKAITWSASASNVWDHAASNFTNNADGTTATFADGDTVGFEDAGVGTVSLSGVLKPGALSFNNSAGNYTLSGSGSIQGLTAVSKSGTGGLTINTSNAYSGGTTVTGGTLTINSASALGTGALNVANGSGFASSVDATLPSLGMGAGGGANISVAAGHTVTFANGVSGGALVVSGAGTVVANGTATTNVDVSANGGLLVIAAPFASNIGTPVSIVTGGGSVKLAAVASPTTNVVAATVNQLSAGGSDQIAVAAVDRSANKQELVVANSFSVGGGGKIDLGNNDAILHAQDAGSVQSLIASGGLASSSATAITRLGVVANDNGAGGPLFTLFDGVSVVQGDTLVKYTYAGDTDLSGIVDASDLANLLAGEHGGLTGWVNGDVDGNGVVNGADLDLLMAAMRGQGASLGDSGAGGRAGAVPEPGAAGMFGAVAGAGLIRRSRRRGASPASA